MRPPVTGQWGQDAQPKPPAASLRVQQGPLRVQQGPPPPPHESSRWFLKGSAHRLVSVISPACLTAAWQNFTFVCWHFFLKLRLSFLFFFKWPLTCKDILWVAGRALVGSP